MSKREAAMRLIGVGFFIGGAIVLSVLAGLWLDNRFNTRPVFMIIGLFVGLAVAFYGVFQMLVPFFNNKKGKGDD